jgi:hypothetical protein
MAPIEFSARDRERISREGVPLERSGSRWPSSEPSGPRRLDRPCTAGDGILVFSGAEERQLQELFEARQGDLRSVKFVPASGRRPDVPDWFGTTRMRVSTAPARERNFRGNFPCTPFTETLPR